MLDNFTLIFPNLVAEDKKAPENPGLILVN